MAVLVRPAFTKRWYGRLSRRATRLFVAVAPSSTPEAWWLTQQLADRGVRSVAYRDLELTVILVAETDRVRVIDVLRGTRWLVSDDWGGHVPARMLGLAGPSGRSRSWGLKGGPDASPIVRIELCEAHEDEWLPTPVSVVARPVPPPVGVADRRQMSSLAPDARETHLPVDVVYTWVDGGDTRWRDRRDALLPGEVAIDASASRYQNRDELRYSLRSVWAHAPWVRRIFLVTDQQRPSWLHGDGITVVDHRELFPDTAVLPTFNSHAIESVLHRIPGLSEHFVYFNDDVFLGRPVKPSLFFSPGGLARLSFSGAAIDYSADDPYARAWRNLADLLERRSGVRPLKVLRHTPHPMLRSHMAGLEEEFPEEFANIRGQRFRGAGDVPPVALSRYTMLQTGEAFERPHAYDYINLSAPEARRRLAGLPASAKRFDTFCLNDTSDAQALEDDVVVAALRRTFPLAAPWEGVVP